jgi:mono/diheme cytochrome c family protein
MSWARRFARWSVLGFAVSVFGVRGLAAQSSSDVPPDLLFARQCSGCHTIGKGDLIGPDLKGVTARHERTWLLRFIRSSREVIDAGDEAATALFERYKRQRMPDHDFTPAQVDALLAYVSTVKTAAADTRSAETATDADVRLGFDLFVGRVPLTTRAPCSACHSVRHPLAGWATTMATFAPELSLVYDRYQDKPLAAFLRAPCCSRRPEAPVTHVLTPDESFALRAFLRDAARHASPPPPGDARRTLGPRLQR